MIERGIHFYWNFWVVQGHRDIQDRRNIYHKIFLQKQLRAFENILLKYLLKINTNPFTPNIFFLHPLKNFRKETMGWNYRNNFVIVNFEQILTK